MSYGVGRRHGLDPTDPTLLWLWRRPVVTALIRPLAWEPPYAMRAAQEVAKRQKEKKKEMALEMRVLWMLWTECTFPPCSVFFHETFRYWP